MAVHVTENCPCVHVAGGHTLIHALVRSLRMVLTTMVGSDCWYVIYILRSLYAWRKEGQ